MRKLHAAGYDVLDDLLATAATLSHWIGPATRVLVCDGGAAGAGCERIGFAHWAWPRREGGRDRAPDGAPSEAPGRGMELPFADDRFDVVFTLGALAAGVDFDAVHAETARVVGPSGVALHYHSREEGRGSRSPTAAGATDRVADFLAAGRLFFETGLVADGRRQAAMRSWRVPGVGGIGVRLPPDMIDDAGAILMERKTIRPTVPRDAVDLWRVGRIDLVPPFTRHGGHAFVAVLPGSAAVGDTPDAPDSSPYLLFEDGRPIGRSHVQHADIARFGRGRHSHWSSQVYFSSSDGSDPNHNGRRYAMLRPPHGPAR